MSRLELLVEEPSMEEALRLPGLPRRRDPGGKGGRVHGASGAGWGTVAA